MIAPRVPSFPSSLGFRLAWTQIGPPPAPHRPPVIPLRIGGIAAAVVFPSRSLLAALPCFSVRPNFSGRLLPIQLGNILVPSPQGETFTQALAGVGVNAAHLSPNKGQWTRGRRGSAKGGLIEL